MHGVQTRAPVSIHRVAVRSCTAYELHHPRHRRLRRHRHRPGAPVTHTRLEVEHYMISRTEIAQRAGALRFRDRQCAQRAHALADQFPPMRRPSSRRFLNLHLMILNDSTLSKAPREIIEREQSNAEWALKSQQAERCSSSSTRSRTVSARAQGRRHAGGRARDQGARRASRGDMPAPLHAKKTRCWSRTTCHPPT